MDKIYRILDVNINRASEGVRVIEDISRFYFEDTEKTDLLRQIRHSIRKIFSEKDFLLFNSRDSINDIGLDISNQNILDDKKDLHQVIKANCKRVTEALRSIEEIGKIAGLYNETKVIEKLRFQFYAIEKDLIKIIRPEIPFGLYGITCEKFSNGRDNITQVKEMIGAGLKIIQYREKYKSVREKYIECLEIRKITSESGVLFIVNDDIEIAKLVNADGVHIGQDDLPPNEVRKLH